VLQAHKYHWSEFLPFTSLILKSRGQFSPESREIDGQLRLQYVCERSRRFANKSSASEHQTLNTEPLNFEIGILG